MAKFTKADFRRALEIMQWKFQKGIIREEQFEMSEIICPVGGAGNNPLARNILEETPSLCGTAACIGGWMALELGGRSWSECYYLMNDAGRQVSAKPDKALLNLFYSYPQDAEKRTTKHGLTALKRYFAGHLNPWRVPADRL